MQSKIRVGTVRVVVTPVHVDLVSTLYRVDVLLYRKRKPLRSKLVDRLDTAERLANALAVSYGTNVYLQDGRTLASSPKRVKRPPPRAPLPMVKRPRADDSLDAIISTLLRSA